MGRLVCFFFVNRFVCFVQCFTIIIIKCKASFSCHSSHKRSLGQVIFLHLFVILFTGGCYPSMHCRWYPACLTGCAIPAYIAGGIPACLAGRVCYPSMHCMWYPSISLFNTRFHSHLISFHFFFFKK